MIALICPSKGRPDKLKRMWESALATADSPEEIALYAGINEEEVPLYSHIKGIKILPVKDWGVVYSTNLMAEIAIRKHQLLYMIGDDAIFTTPGWDTELIKQYEALDNKMHVFCLRDSRSENGTPHPIATREWVEAVGYMACPIFMHWHVDSWMVDTAKLLGCFTHLMDYLLVHEKPSDHGIIDDTHRTIRERGWLGRDNYVNNKLKGTVFGSEFQRIRNKYNATTGVKYV